MTGAIAGLAATIAYECHDINHVVIPCNGAEDHTRLVLKWTGAVAAANMSIDSVNQKGVYYVRYINAGPADVRRHGHRCVHEHARDRRLYGVV